MITRSALFALILLVTSFSAPKALVDTFTFSFMNTMGTPPGTLPDKLYYPVEEFSEAAPTVFYVIAFRQLRFFGQLM